MTVEDLYKASLQQRGIDETKMGPVQREQIKRAFYSGATMILLHNTQVLPKMKPEEAAKELVTLTKQCTEFWNTEKLKDSHEKNISDHR